MDSLLTTNTLNDELKYSLEQLKKHIEDTNTDFHNQFYPEKKDQIKKSIEKLENNNELDFRTLSEVSDILNFKRMSPALELAEKKFEMEQNVSSRLENIIYSYGNWGIEENRLSQMNEKYQEILLNSVYEGLFRKGIKKSDREAWSSIKFNKGGRTLYKYIFDVVKGWPHEDLCAIWAEEVLKSSFPEAKVLKEAHDSERVFKYSKKGQSISGEPDLQIDIEGTRVALEIQHVTKNSRVKTKNLIRVPSHRIEESKKWGENYILLIPYVEDDQVTNRAAIFHGPLEESDREDHIKGEFYPLEEVEEKLIDMTNN